VVAAVPTIVFDSDVMLKSAVRSALIRLKGFLDSRGAHVLVIYLSPGPNGRRRGSTTSSRAAGQ